MGLLDEIASEAVVDAAYQWIQQVNDILADLKLEKHPDKTGIGCVDRAFDFSGYRFVAGGL